MLFSTIFASAALPLLALASPIKRAGGPAITPIPASCHVFDPLPRNSTNCEDKTLSGFQPSPAAYEHQIYSWYLGQPDYQTVEQRWTTCIEQCYGLSGCKSAFLAYNAPTPKGYYGTEGGVLSVGCLMFNATLNPTNFVSAKPGQYANATAGNIVCPT